MAITGNVISQLSPENTDNGFAHFELLLAEVRLPKGFVLGEMSDWSRQGRRLYGAHIWHPDWRPGGMKETSSGKWSLNPDTDFFIHCEPQYHVLTGSFNLYLHYEIDPYHPEKWAQANIIQSDYQAYLRKRMRFKEYFDAEGISGWKVGGRCCQIAKASLAVTGETSMQDLIRQIERHIDSVTPVVNALLQIR